MLDATRKVKIQLLAGLSQCRAFADAAGRVKIISDTWASAFPAAHEIKQR
jgi:hypothetical protein